MMNINETGVHVAPNHPRETKLPRFRVDLPIVFAIPDRSSRRCLLDVRDPESTDGSTTSRTSLRPRQLPSNVGLTKAYIRSIHNRKVALRHVNEAFTCSSPSGWRNVARQQYSEIATFSTKSGERVFAAAAICNILRSVDYDHENT